MPFLELLACLMLSICLWALWKGEYVSGTLLLLGTLGFVGAPILLPQTGSLFQRIELPNYFQTTTIVGRNDHLFSLNEPLQRIQRYSSDGVFEKGWFIDNAGGPARIGLTKANQIAVYASRRKKIFLFDLSGTKWNEIEANPKWSDSRLLKPTDFQLQGIELIKAKAVTNPSSSWLAFLLFPLWHPVAGWLLLCIAILLKMPETIKKMNSTD